jgi:hypothetical protein
MAWPDNINHVKCTGFSKKILPHLKQHIDSGSVKWTDTHHWMDESTGHFDWAGCEWEFTEIMETVIHIELLKGTLNDTSLTMAVLRG